MMHSMAPALLVPRLMSAKSVLVEVPWYGLGKIYFTIDLEGMAGAIAESFQTCGAEIPSLEPLTRKTKRSIILANDEAKTFENVLRKTHKSTRRRG